MPASHPVSHTPSHRSHGPAAAVPTRRAGRVQVAGIVVKRNFKEDGSVKKGQSLYSLDAAPFHAALARVESPIAGSAGRSQVSEGSLVSGAQVLLTTVTQSDPMKLRFGIADTDQTRWRSEAAAGQLQLPARRTFEVEVNLLDGSAPRYAAITSPTTCRLTAGRSAASPRPAT